MRILVQRVFQAWVRVEGTQISRIKEGILVLVGITEGDNLAVAQHMASKALNMRLWERDGKAWNASVMDVKGQVMAVSQFTLYGIMKGNKPDFHGAMQADAARDLFENFVSILKKKYQQNKIQTGKFQHLMEVGSINNGPVTIHYEKKAQQKQKKQIPKPSQKKEKKKQQSTTTTANKIQKKIQSISIEQKP